MTTYLYMNTKDAIQNTNPADARFSLNFQNYGESKTFISLEQTTIPIVVAPVNSNNNVLELQENSGASTSTITLDERSYTGAELAVELKAKLDAGTGAGNTFTVSYSSPTKKISITADTTNFNFGSNSTALKVIGFSAGTTYTAATVARISENVVRLDGSTYLDIVSSFSSRNICSNGRTNVLARIPILAGYGSVQTYQHQNNSRIPINNRDVDTCSIYLIDDDDNRVVMPSQADVSYVFKLSFE